MYNKIRFDIRAILGNKCAFYGNKRAIQIMGIITPKKHFFLNM